MKQAKKWMQSALEKFKDAESAIDYFEGILSENDHSELDISSAKYALENRPEVEKWYDDQSEIYHSELTALCEEKRIEVRESKGAAEESICSDIAFKLSKDYPFFNNYENVRNYYKALTSAQWASKEPKVIRSFRLDAEVIKYFEKEAERTGISINALINSALLQLVRGSK